MKNLARSLASGYAALAANILYTLGSIPLALLYLSKAEFGLWALSLQIGVFLGLADMGVSFSLARLLIDHKDHREDGRYGSLLGSGLLVLTAQGIIVLGVGLGLCLVLPDMLRIPETLTREFIWLTAGQVAITAAGFPTRIFWQLLYAHQRLDLQNYSQILQLAISFAALWIGFEAGLGVYSLLAASAAGWLAVTGLSAASCFWLQLWPAWSQWSRGSWQQFREIFSFGADLFLISLGMQCLLSSQAMIISRTMGVEAAAVWSIMTKTFSLVLQALGRIINNATPALAEMLVRGERERLGLRYRQLYVFVSALSGAGAVLLAAGNQSFVGVWTDGRISWPAWNNWLLGAWLILLSFQMTHTGLLACAKTLRTLKYFYLLEAGVFIAAGLYFTGEYGFTALLGCVIACISFFSVPASLSRAGSVLGVTAGELVWRWNLPLLRLLSAMVPSALGLSFLTRDFAPLPQFLLSEFPLAILAIFLLLKHAIPAELTSRLRAYTPGLFQPVLEKIVNHTANVP